MRTLSIALAAAALAACQPSQTTEDAPGTPPDAAAPSPTETANAALEGLLDDQTGRQLAEAYRAHAPDVRERRRAAAFWLLAAHGAATGDVPELMLSPGLTEAMASLAGVPGADAGPEANGAPLISEPPQCSDDCLPAFGPVVRRTAAAASALLPVTATLEGAAARFVLRMSGRRDLGSMTVEQLDGLLETELPDDEMVDTLDRVGRAHIPAVALTKAAVDLGLVAAEVGALASAAGAITAGLAGASLGLTVATAWKAWDGCRSWQAANCAGVDAGVPRADGGLPRADAGLPPADAGAPSDVGSSGSPDLGLNRIVAFRVEDPPVGDPGYAGACDQPGGPGTTYTGTWPAVVQIALPAAAGGVWIRVEADRPEIAVADLRIPAGLDQFEGEIEFTDSIPATPDEDRLTAVLTATCRVGCSDAAPPVEATIELQRGEPGPRGEACGP
jgi:hypothetical protein